MIAQKVTLKLESGARRCKPEHDHAVADGTCPHCGATQFKVQGCGKRIAPDDQAYEADAVAVCCKQYVGTLRVEVNTLFGVREDEAVLHGRARVY